ncbi:MAG: hypothetical protein ACPGJH_08965, partial [Alphaproteobacteria bacterium]
TAVNTTTQDEVQTARVDLVDLVALADDVDFTLSIDGQSVTKTSTSGDTLTSLATAFADGATGLFSSSAQTAASASQSRVILNRTMVVGETALVGEAATITASKTLTASEATADGVETYQIDLSELGGLVEGGVYTIQVGAESVSTTASVTDSFASLATVFADNASGLFNARADIDVTAETSILTITRDISLGGVALAGSASSFGYSKSVNLSTQVTDRAVTDTLTIDVSDIAANAGEAYTLVIADDAQVDAAEDDRFTVVIPYTVAAADVVDTLGANFASIVFAGDAKHDVQYDSATNILTIERLLAADESDTFVGGQVSATHKVVDRTGALSLNIAKFEADRFELRAGKSVEVVTTNDLLLNGFVGGVAGFDYTGDVELTVGGNLTLQGGIVAATENLVVRADGVASDGASVFVATELSITSQGEVQANTLADYLSVDVAGTGNIDINEADALIVNSIKAADGTIRLATGGDTIIHDIANTADGDNINLEISGNLQIDRIEAGTSVGTEKTGGVITIDTLGTISEYKDPTPLDVTSRDDDLLRGADVVGYQIDIKTPGAAFNGFTSLVSPGDQDGSGDKLNIEIRQFDTNRVVNGVSIPDQDNSTLTVAAQRLTGGVSVSGTVTEVAAPGEDVNQVTVLSIPSSFDIGSEFRVTVEGDLHTRTVALGETLDVILSDLAASIIDVNQDGADDGHYTVAIDAAAPSMTITAVAANTSFTASVEVVSFDTETLPGIFTNSGLVPVVAAGEDATQTTRLYLEGDNVLSGPSELLTAVIDGVRYYAASSEPYEIYVTGAQAGDLTTTYELSSTSDMVKVIALDPTMTLPSNQTYQVQLGPDGNEIISYTSASVTLADVDALGAALVQ